MHRSPSPDPAPGGREAGSGHAGKALPRPAAAAAPLSRGSGAARGRPGAELPRGAALTQAAFGAGSRETLQPVLVREENLAGSSPCFRLAEVLYKSGRESNNGKLLGEPLQPPLLLCPRYANHDEWGGEKNRAIIPAERRSRR